MVIQTRHLVWTALILIVLIALGIGLWLWLRPTDENLIRARFGKLSELVSKNTREGAIPAVTRAKEAASLFTEKSSFAVDGLDWMAGPFTREKLSANMFRSRSMFDKITLSLDDLELEIDPEKGSAKIFLTAVLSGTLKDGRAVREVRELECNMVKTDEGWLFDSFRVRQIIKK